MFPETLPTGAAYDALVQRVLTNEIIRGKLLSEDGTLALVVLSLDPKIVGGKGLKTTVGEIRKTMQEDLGSTGLTAQLAGVPTMQLEIRNAVERDTLLYNTIGFVAGCLIAIAFFRRISFMIIAAAPPLIAILLSLGALGWFNFSLNMFLNVMTPLIMVISFSDSMQLTFAARDRLIAGKDKYTAFREAVLVVGPACVLTHGTAGISFIALQFSSSEAIRTFGEAGLMATVIALLAVLSLVPLLGVLLIRKETSFAVGGRGADIGVEALRSFCRWIALRMVSHPGLYSLIGLLVVVGLSVIYINLEPRYRLADQVPDKRQAVEASGRLDAKLTGANPIDVLIEFPKGASLYDNETLDTLAAVHTIVEKQAGVGNVWSVDSLRRWLAEKAGKADLATLKQYLEILPEHLTRRFVSADKDAVVVSGRIPDIDSSQLLPVVNKLDNALDEVRKAHPGYEIAVTGLAAIAARNSADMIGKLNQALTVEIVFVAAFIGSGVPFVRRDAGEHPARHLPGGDGGRGAVGDGGGPAIRQRRGADGVVRAGSQRHHPLPQPAAAGGQAGGRSCHRGGAGDHPGRAGADPDIGGAGVRACGDGALGPAVAAPVRLALGLRHAGGADRGSVDPAADGDVRESTGDALQEKITAGRITSSSRYTNYLPRIIMTATSETSLPGDRIEMLSALPLVLINSAAVTPTDVAVAVMLVPLILPASEPITPREVSFQEPEMLAPSAAMSLPRSN